MARHLSVEKRARQNKKRRARNMAIRHRTRRTIRRLQEAIEAGDRTKAETALAESVRMLYRAASKGVIHSRNVSRRVSRLHSRVKRLGEAEAAPKPVKRRPPRKSRTKSKTASSRKSKK